MFKNDYDLEKDNLFFLSEIPTLIAVEKFDKESDCKKLRNSVKGLGTDERPIIEILCNRSYEQRQILIETYKNLFNRNLVTDLRNDLSGYFKDTIDILMKNKSELCAFYMRKALHSSQINFRIIIEMLTFKSSSQLVDIKLKFEQMFGISLENEIRSKCKFIDKNEDLLIFIDSLINVPRSESKLVDLGEISKDLVEIFNGNFNKNRFLTCILSRSYAHLKAMFNKFHKDTGYSVGEELKELNGEFKEAALYFVDYINDQVDYYARLVLRSTKGLLVNDDDLIRIIITRCEIDMENVKRKLSQDYNEILSDLIKKNTSYYYQKALLMLIAERNLIKWTIYSDIARFIPRQLANISD